MSALNNKWLLVRDGVVLTPSIEVVIIGLEPHFAAASVAAFVTSGKRNAEEQLAIIKTYAIEHGVDKIYPSILSAGLTDKGIFEGKQVFVWQPAWSELLHQGIIVNPPLQATCLFDYISKGVNKKGKLIDPSVHFKGTAFDIGGGTNLEAVVSVIEKAYASRTIAGWLGFRVEPMNRAVHNDCLLRVA